MSDPPPGPVLITNSLARVGVKASVPPGPAAPPHAATTSIAVTSPATVRTNDRLPILRTSTSRKALSSLRSGQTGPECSPTVDRWAIERPRVTITVSQCGTWHGECVEGEAGGEGACPPGVDTPKGRRSPERLGLR